MVCGARLGTHHVLLGAVLNVVHADADHFLHAVDRRLQLDRLGDAGRA